MATLTITSGTAQVVVDPSLGGRVVSLVVRGNETICAPAPGLDTFGHGIYPMVPFAGRARDARVTSGGLTAVLRPGAGPHALHGLVHSTAWNVVARSDSSLSMSTDLCDPWPWRARVTHTLAVSERSLRMELRLLAIDAQPAMVGWHPWFARPCATDLSFGAMYERGSDHLPTGRLVPPRTEDVDDCFVEPLEDPVVVANGTRLVLHSDCSHWVVYDGAEHGVCVEPQSGAPNQVNDSPVVVPAGGHLRRWFSIHW